MEFEGTVYKVLPLVKGTSQRGEWMKQEVVFELPGEFNRKICVGFWGDKAHDAGALREGEKVAVSIKVESREYNGRWFTEDDTGCRTAADARCGRHAAFRGGESRLFQRSGRRPSLLTGSLRSGPHHYGRKVDAAPFLPLYRQKRLV